jgi:hypothetical protein
MFLDYAPPLVEVVCFRKQVTPPISTKEVLSNEG